MRPHVLLTTDVVGGVWDFALCLTRELHARQTARVTLLALGEPSADQRAQADRAGARLLAEPLKLEWMRDADLDVQRTRALVGGLVTTLRPDIVHANQFAAACVEVDVPVVLTLHSDVVSWRRWTLGATGHAPEWAAYTSLVRQALARADRVVAVSRFLAAETAAGYGTRREVGVIHNGWPAPGPGREGERMRATVVAGRVWDAAKNISLAAVAAQGWPAGPVYLAGDQTSPDSGQHVDAPPPLQALGFLARPALDRLLRASRAYLSPARYDPFGLLPLQAALNGCALLLSDIPSYRELWDGAAVFFQPNDAADLRRAWSRVLDEPGLAADLASRARQRAVERYSATGMADAYAALYRSVGAALPTAAA